MGLIAAFSLHGDTFRTTSEITLLRLLDIERGGYTEWVQERNPRTILHLTSPSHFIIQLLSFKLTSQR